MEVLESKPNLVVSKQVVVDIFLQKIKNKNFANYVITCGLRELSYSQWSVFIRDRAREFNEASLAASFMGISKERSTVQSDSKVQKLVEEIQNLEPKMQKLSGSVVDEYDA